MWDGLYLRGIVVGFGFVNVVGGFAGVAARKKNYSLTSVRTVRKSCYGMGVEVTVCVYLISKC